MSDLDSASVQSDYDKWRERVLTDSEKYLEIYKEYAKHDLDDWDSVAWSTLSESGAGASCLIFAGPSGSGKHTALSAFVNRIDNNDDVDMILIIRRRLLDSGVQFVMRLMDECRGNEMNCYFLFDRPADNYPEELLELIEDTVTTEQNFGFILVSDDEVETSSVLRQFSRIFRFGALTTERRRRFVSANCVAVRDLVDLDYLVEAGSGLTYGNLTEIIRILDTECALKGAVGRERIDDLISMFVSKNPIEILATKIDEAVSEIREIGESLSEAVKSVGAGMISVNSSNGERATSADAISASVTSADATEAEREEGSVLTRKEVEEMAPLDLSYDLFGKERTEALRQRAAEIENSLRC